MLSSQVKNASWWVLGLLCLIGAAGMLSAKPPQLPDELTPTVKPETATETPEAECPYCPCCPSCPCTAKAKEEDVPVLKKKKKEKPASAEATCPYLKDLAHATKPAANPAPDLPDVFTNLENLQLAERWLNEAEAHMKAGRFREARDCYDRIVHLLPFGPWRIQAMVATLKTALDKQPAQAAGAKEPTEGATSEEAEDGQKPPEPEAKQPAEPDLNAEGFGFNAQVLEVNQWGVRTDDHPLPGLRLLVSADFAEVWTGWNASGRQARPSFSLRQDAELNILPGLVIYLSNSVTRNEPGLPAFDF